MIEIAMTPGLQNSIQLLLTTALSTLSQAGLNLALERTSEDSGPLEASTVLAAVEAAVETARAEFLDQLNVDGLNFNEEAELLAFLHKPELPEEIVKRLLFDERPDFARLESSYTGKHWDAIARPLILFIRRVETCLLADPVLARLLDYTRTQFLLGKIDNGLETVAKINREISGTVAEVLDVLLQSLRNQQILISQQRKYFDEFLAEQRRDRLPVDSQLEEPEQRYLRWLAKESDELLLASDRRGQHEKNDVIASLANVYVDLATTARPSFERILDRLAVPEGDRPGLREKMRGGAERGVGLEMTELEMAQSEMAQLKMAEATKRRPGAEKDDFEKHPLRSYVENAEQLQEVVATPLTTLEALADHAQLVLLGDPGSGKSTFVNHLANTFARAHLGKGGLDWRDVTGNLFERPLFPIRIVLREWSSQWTDAEGQEAFYQELARLDPDISRERWQKRLDHEGTLVLLDGLDEVPTVAGETKSDRRQQMLDAVKRFRSRHENCRVLVTCRVKPYTDEYRLQGWPSFELAKLDEPRIENFCGRWYSEQERLGNMNTAEEVVCRDRLLGALQSRKILKDMAGTPLLLTMLARVNARAPLPEGRVQLYHECVEQLLWEWEKSKGEGKDGEPRKLDQLLQESEPPVTREDIERLLWSLTFEFHGESGDEEVDLPTARLRTELAALYRGEDEDEGWTWAQRIIKLIRQRSGLLIARTDQAFRFPHRSFQEYLAARGLLLEEDPPLVAAEKSAEDIWWEVILLACARLRSDPFRVQNIVEELIGKQDPHSTLGARRILLAGRIWSEFDPHHRKGTQGDRLHEKLPGLLTQAMHCSDLPAPQRHAAGLLACDLGDVPEELREEVFVELPEKWFGYPFRIGKYPVTNAQFRRFVEEGGYDREKGWIREEGWKQMASYRSDLTQPRLWANRDWNHDTQPVVGVSWYEAEAYCKWLTERLRSSGKITADEVVRLPTFEERKKAAEGSSGREFPWGKEEEVHRLNCKESEIGVSSPVHMFLQGKTEEGVWDLSGNVWEWTADEEKKNFPAYVLGGGSFFWNISLSSSAARNWYDAGRWSVGSGFRVSVSPLLL